MVKEPFDAAVDYKPRDPSEPNDLELTMLNVMLRHGRLKNREVVTLTQKLERHCTVAVLDEMFPKGVKMAEEFEPRQFEFETKLRQMIRDYGQAKFNLPGVEIRGDKSKPTAP